MSSSRQQTSCFKDLCVTNWNKGFSIIPICKRKGFCVLTEKLHAGAKANVLQLLPRLVCQASKQFRSSETYHFKLKVAPWTTGREPVTILGMAEQNALKERNFEVMIIGPSTPLKQLSHFPHISGEPGEALSASFPLQYFRSYLPGAGKKFLCIAVHV